MIGLATFPGGAGCGDSAAIGASAGACACRDDRSLESPCWSARWPFAVQEALIHCREQRRLSLPNLRQANRLGIRE